MSRAWPVPVLSALALALAGCAETPLPDLTVATGKDTRFGIDMRHHDYTLGWHITDPLHQRNP